MNIHILRIEGWGVSNKYVYINQKVKKLIDA